MRVAAAIVAISAGLLVTGAGTAGSTRVLESITVSNATATGVASTTILQKGTRYRLVASGTVSDWCSPTSCPAGNADQTAQPNVGVDPLYCYAKWRCPTPELWRQLVVNGMGLDQIAGQAGKIPYSAGHSYTVTMCGTGAELHFVAADALGSAGDNSGAFKVELSAVGPDTACGSGPEAGLKVTLLAGAHQNTDEYGELTFALSGKFTSKTPLSACKTQCNVPLVPSGTFHGLQHDGEWHGLKDLRIKFQIVSARLDKGPGQRLAVDIVGKVVSSLGTPNGGAAPGSPDTCRTKQQIGVYVQTVGAAKRISFGCGAVLHVYHRSLVAKILVSG